MSWIIQCRTHASGNSAALERISLSKPRMCEGVHIQQKKISYHILILLFICRAALGVLAGDTLAASTEGRRPMDEAARYFIEGVRFDPWSANIPEAVSTTGPPGSAAREYRRDPTNAPPAKIDCTRNMRRSRRSVVVIVSVPPLRPWKRSSHSEILHPKITKLQVDRLSAVQSSRRRRRKRSDSPRLSRAHRQP